jgi:hypothetical protein
MAIQDSLITYYRVDAYESITDKIKVVKIEKRRKYLNTLGKYHVYMYI